MPEQLVGLSDLLKQTERRYVTAKIPGVGSVRFRSLTAAEHLDLEQSFLDSKGQPDLRKFKERTARMIARTMCDENGNLVCSSEDIPKIMQLDAKVVDAMTDVINDHCINRKRVEDLVGNSNGECLSEHSAAVN